MSSSAHTTARIEFLVQTLDEHGQIVHAPGDVVIGVVLGRRRDFLFVQPATGPCLCIDTSRSDLYALAQEQCVGGGA